MRLLHFGGVEATARWQGHAEQLEINKSFECLDLTGWRHAADLRAKLSTDRRLHRATAPALQPSALCRLRPKARQRLH